MAWIVAPVQVKAISERRFDRLVKKYQHVPVGLSGETEYRDPSPTSSRITG